MDNSKTYNKLDKYLIKMTVILFIILLLTQWYLRLTNKGIESFFERLNEDKNLSFKRIDILPVEKLDELNIE